MYLQPGGKELEKAMSAEMAEGRLGSINTFLEDLQ